MESRDSAAAALDGECECVCMHVDISLFIGVNLMKHDVKPGQEKR